MTTPNDQTAAGATPAAPAPSPRSIATALAVTRWIEKRRLGKVIGDRVAQLKATTDDGLPVLAAGENTTAHIAGEVFAKVTMPTASYTLTVANPDEFAGWLEKEFPGEVTYTVTFDRHDWAQVAGLLAEHGISPTVTRQVRPAFFDVLSAAAAHGVTTHPRTGEETPIPGLKVGRTNPSPTVNFVKHADQVIERAYRAGLFDAGALAEMLALPTSPAVETPKDQS